MTLALLAAGYGLGFLSGAAVCCYLIIRGHKASIAMYQTTKEK